MLKITGYVMLFAPLAVWAAITATVAEERPRRALEALSCSWVASISALAILWVILIAVGFIVLGPRYQSIC